MDEAFDTRARTCRAVYNVSVKRIASIIGVPASTWYRWEKYACPPKPDAVSERIDVLLRLSVDEGVREVVRSKAAGAAFWKRVWSAL